MRFNKWRDREPTAGIEHFITFAARIAHRGDIAKTAFIYRDLP